MNFFCCQPELLVLIIYSRWWQCSSSAHLPLTTQMKMVFWKMNWVMGKVIFSLLSARSSKNVSLAYFLEGFSSLCLSRCWLPITERRRRGLCQDHSTSVTCRWRSAGAQVYSSVACLVKPLHQNGTDKGKCSNTERREGQVGDAEPPSPAQGFHLHPGTVQSYEGLLGSPPKSWRQAAPAPAWGLQGWAQP